GRDRTAVGRKPLVALPRPLSAPAPLSRTGAAFRKSFRPTASRTRGTSTETPQSDQAQISCACKSPLEKTMEADISIWQKPGHFYFALTALNLELARCASPVLRHTSSLLESFSSASLRVNGAVSRLLEGHAAHCMKCGAAIADN